MSQHKNVSETITNSQLLIRLLKLDIVRRLPVATFIAYVCLQLLNHGKVVPFTKAVKIIKSKGLDKVVKKNPCLPTDNVLEALIFLVIYKRKLCQEIFDQPECEIFENEITAPLFDIMETISKIYKV